MQMKTCDLYPFNAPDADSDFVNRWQSIKNEIYIVLWKFRLRKNADDVVWEM